MTKVYAVTTGTDGTYSEDYGIIHGIFSSAAKANEFVAAKFGDNIYGYVASIEEWELNQPRED